MPVAKNSCRGTSHRSRTHLDTAATPATTMAAVQALDLAQAMDIIMDLEVALATTTPDQAQAMIMDPTTETVPFSLDVAQETMDVDPETPDAVQEITDADLETTDADQETMVADQKTTQPIQG